MEEKWRCKGRRLYIKTARRANPRTARGHVESISSDQTGRNGQIRKGQPFRIERNNAKQTQASFKVGAAVEEQATHIACLPNRWANKILVAV